MRRIQVYFQTLISRLASGLWHGGPTGSSHRCKERELIREWRSDGVCGRRVDLPSRRGSGATTRDERVDEM